SELPVAGKIERDRFVPRAVGRINRQGPAAAGVVDEDIDTAQFGRCPRGDLCRRVVLHHVLRHGDDGTVSLIPHLLRKRLEQIGPPRDGNDTDSFVCKPLGDGAPDSDAGSGDNGSSGFEIEIHTCILVYCTAAFWACTLRHTNLSQYAGADSSITC